MPGVSAGASPTFLGGLGTSATQFWRLSSSEP